MAHSLPDQKVLEGTERNDRRKRRVLHFTVVVELLFGATYIHDMAPLSHSFHSSLQYNPYRGNDQYYTVNESSCFPCLVFMPVLQLCFILFDSSFSILSETFSKVANESSVIQTQRSSEKELP